MGKHFNKFCCQQGPCFGRDNDDKTRCKILNSTYPEGKKCPFQKPVREITRGRYYPYNKLYVGREEDLE